ncbi:MAG TPA: sugar transferase [Desulfotomaculum sp.]|nr:MAG: Undecaprenyl-phosphate galactose phosphotransferase [Desulfotomaculum sp. 46_80]HBY02951.1 sugar transferase [Desulfotomaculum sp.]
MNLKKANLFFKRAFDIVLTLFILICFSPVILLIILMTKLTSPGEVVFRQERLGQHGKVFYLLKFRSMIRGAQQMGSGMFLEENDDRITPFGKILRRTGLDELPQLFNVLKGEMSIVGPRPAPLHHLDKYDEEQKRRLSVKPGVTGWAQVNGRVALYWPDRIKLDLWYIDNYSFKLDLLILFKTALSPLDRKNSVARADRKENDPFMKY